MNVLASFVSAAMARESAKECGMRFANGMAGSLECLSNLVHPVNPVQTPGGSVTLCADEPWLDPTVPQKIYFEMKMYAGYQHVCTVVYDEDGEYVATVYPAQGLRELPIMTVTSVVTMVNLIPSGIWR